jgi:hypothetical protein
MTIDSSKLMNKNNEPKKDDRFVVKYKGMLGLATITGNSSLTGLEKLEVEITEDITGKYIGDLFHCSIKEVEIIRPAIDEETASPPLEPVTSDIDEESIALLEKGQESLDEFFLEPSYIHLQPTNPSEHAMKEFVKDGQEKPRFSLLPISALQEVMHVMGYGAKKYAEHNYSKGERNTTYTDAAHRHLLAYQMGENIDLESNRHHLAHAVACILMGLDNELNGVSIEGRNPIYLKNTMYELELNAIKKEQCK